MEHILRGKEVAAAIMERNRPIITGLKEKGILPTLAIFRVGEKEADLSYERGAIKRFEQCGIQTIRYTFDENVSVEDFYQKLDEANKDPKIHGILVFRPLPKDRFDDTTLRNFISPEKDVDGCSDLSLAGIFTGRDLGFPPCTAQAVLEILDHYQIDVEGKNVVVLGRSLVIGRPVSLLLMQRNATVTICHTRTKDLTAIASKADILVCTTGRPEMVNKTFTHPKQIIIDVGIEYSEKKQKLSGDVDYEEVEPFVQAITPVPGGVGSVTTSVLVDHVVKAALTAE
ncbi:MAG: bifunctional 5,10-methylene-tetrahydrofolate dehydrogenase/5,10-methylene-tetrahydrofolate cyclohydrolase [Erysipelotrichaceae bacterium]|nr:bifunctional 5,10-methylene-tetrahydrofolate dehydrogenase/5,10-methylene-tetrahydrofolate cyclohydrolase [Erysipelotrichaceae bacterium]